MADYGIPRLSSALLENWFNKQSDPLPPWMRQGTKSPVTGVLSATPERPSDWAVSSGLAETLSPTVQGYGAGQMAGDAYQAAKAGDYGSASGYGVLAAMGMMPMAGKVSAKVPTDIPLGVKAAEREPVVKLYHGTTPDGYAGIMADGKIDGPAYLGPKEVAKRYGTEIVEVEVPKSQLQVDMDLGTNHMFSVEDANSYLGHGEPWTIDDYINRGYALGVPGGVATK